MRVDGRVLLLHVLNTCKVTWDKEEASRCAVEDIVYFGEAFNLFDNKVDRNKFKGETCYVMYPKGTTEATIKEDIDNIMHTMFGNSDNIVISEIMFYGDLMVQDRRKLKASKLMAV